MSTLSLEKPGPTSFVDTLFGLLDRVDYRRARLDEVTDPVYRLRYEAYRREEFIASNDAHVASDRFDAAPNVMCYGVYIDGALVSSIRLHHVTPGERTSPSRSIYQDVLDPMLDSGLSYIDPSRFTADRDATLAFPALPFLTLRLAAMASVHFNVDYCLASVRPEHAAFYRRVFAATQLGDERYYPGLLFPVCMYAAKVPHIRAQVHRRYPFLMATEEEHHALFGPGPGSFRPVRPSARMAQRLTELSAETA